MTPDIALTLGIILAAIVLFATEKLRVDVIALLVLLTVGLTGLVDAEHVFSGFANPAVITVWAVYIVSGALFRTGVADLMGRFILRLSGDSEARLIAVIMITCGTMSAFMNNVGATAMLLPAMVAVSRRTKVPVSKLLIPLAFSSLMGGNMTLIGTPANILASNILLDKGLETFSLFQFLPTGAAIFGAGIIYMIFIGRRLIPVRQSPDQVDSAADLRQYVSEAHVAPTSPLVGRSLIESGLGADHDLTVIAIHREEETLTALRRDTRIEAGDLLVLSGASTRLVAAGPALDIHFNVGDNLTADRVDEIGGDEVALIEATLSPRSRVVGLDLEEARFRDRYGFTALAIRRDGEVITHRLRDEPLEFGDALLLQGPRHRLEGLQEGDDFLVLEPVASSQKRIDKAPLATLIMLGVILLVIFGILEIAVAMVLGAVMMVITACLTMEEAYESIDWRTVFLVAGMLPLGIAMESTGTARFLAELMIDTVGGLGPMGVLAGVYILSALMTQPMSNAAAVVLMVPIAVDIATGIGGSHLPFVLAAVIGASTSFLTPVGHKANVLVFGPGGYRFFDYTRVGALLTVLLLIVSLLVIPLVWPIFP